MATYVRHGPSTIDFAGPTKLYCVDLEIAVKFMAITFTILGGVLLLTSIVMLSLSGSTTTYGIALLFGILHVVSNALLIFGLLKRSLHLVMSWIVSYVAQIITFFSTVCIGYATMSNITVNSNDWRIYVILGSIYCALMYCFIKVVWKFFKEIRYEKENPMLVSKQYTPVPTTVQLNGNPIPQPTPVVPGHQ